MKEKNKNTNQILPTQKKSESNGKENSKEEGKEMQNQLMQNNENGMREIQMLQTKSISKDKNESHIDSYEPAFEIFQKEYSESNNYLNESVKLLHDQTKQLLKVDSPEVRKVDAYNMEQARANINALAKVIQTKINFIKALK